MNLFVGIFFLFTFISVGLSLNVYQIKKLEYFIENVVRCRKVPGLAVALVRRNETVYTRGFGVREVNSLDIVTDTTLFNLASESKAFTTTVAADAVAKGKIKWDDPVREVLGPHFRLQDDFRSEEASLRDFLSHRVGVPSYWNLASGLMNFTRRQILERIMDFPTRYEFRERYLYSNYMYVAAAAVVETATCETWEDAVYNKIFKPLDMTGSRLSTRLSDADWNNIAFSDVVTDNDTIVQDDEKALIGIGKFFAPAAGVYSHAQDMAKWMRFHLNDGKNEKGDQVIDAHALKDTYHPSTAEYSPSLTRAHYPVDDMLFSYAMGWRNGIYNGYRKLVHTAAYNNYQGTLTLIPDEGVGVWVQISGAADGNGRPSRNMITMYALDLLLGDKPWLNASTACTFPAPWKEPPVVNQPTTTLAPTLQPGWFIPSIFINTTEYIGSYHHPAFGTLEIFDDDHQHLMTYRYGDLMRGYLTAKGEDFFQILTGPMAIKHYDYSSYPNGFPVTFHRDASGTIQSVQFHFLSFSMTPTFTVSDVKANTNTVTSDKCKIPSTKAPKTSTSSSGSSSIVPALFLPVLILMSHTKM